jgi:hypothetical protein
MTPGELAAVRGRLEEFAAEMFAPLACRDQRDKGATYLRGLLLDGLRKSMQPMAEQLGRRAIQVVTAAEQAGVVA